MRFKETSWRSSVLQGVLWVGTGTFVGQFISWLSTIVIIRLLAPSDYGLMAMTAVFVSLVAMVSELGVSAALIQAKDLAPREIRQISTWVWMTGVFGFLACYTLAPWVARFYAEPELTPMIRLLGINMILMMSYAVPQSLFIREMNFKVKAQIDLSAQLGTTVLTLLLALKGMGVWSLLVGQVAMQMVKALAFNVARPFRMMPLLDLRGSGKLLRYGLALTGDRLLNFVYAESDKIIVGKFLSTTALGSYAVALNLASIPMEKVLPIITQVSFASYARIQDNVDRIRKNILLTTRLIAFIAFPTFFGMSAVAPVGIPLILGAKWESIVEPFQLLCLILPLRALSPILPPAIFAIGRPMVNLVNMMITSTIMASAFFIGVNAGVTGVCLAWLAAYPVAFGITTLRSLPILGLSTGCYLSELGFPLIAGSLMLASVSVLETVLVTPGPLYSLIVLIGFGVVCYLSLVKVFKNDQYGEMRAFLRSR